MPELILPQESRRRYPGLLAFDVSQQRIYKGRDKEAADLFDLTKVETATLLFSRSGLGKSSLINAGLSPKLQGAGYWPIRIRFQRQSKPMAGAGQNGQTDEQPVAIDSPIKIVINTLHTEFDNAGKLIAARQVQLATAQEGPEQAEQQANNRWLGKVDYVEGQGYRTNQPILFDADKPRLWEQVKIHPFPNAVGIALLFDQFEEFFAYTLAQREEFLLQLAELLHDRPPTRVINWMMTATPDDPTPEQVAWGIQPLVRCVFAIRSDRLFEMDSLRSYVPLVFRNRYELSPLREQAARDAIEQPAKTPGNFDTPPFTYHPDTLSLLIDSLQDKNREVDSSQLQMVCNYVENKVNEHYKASKERGGLKPIVVDAEIIPSRQKIDDIIKEYYNNQLNALTNDADIQLAGYVLETYFVVNGQRVGVEEPTLLGYLEDRSDIIQQLMKVRLIRAETTTRGTDAYELSHDKLIEPVEEAKSKRNTDHYYRSRLSLLSDPDDRERVSRVLEEHFVKRNQAKAVSEINLLNFLTNRRDLIDQLVSVRLIRPLTQQGEPVYELDNDMLIAPIDKAKEKREKRKLVEERDRLQRLRNRLGLTILACLLLLVVGAYFLRQSTLLRKTATNTLAVQQYSIGKQYVAYRLWQQVEDTIPSDRLFVPFAGLNTQTDITDTTLAYVATLYRDNKLELWRKGSSAYEKINELTVQSPTSFRLKNRRLVYAQGDSLLQVVKLTENRKSPLDTLFPIGKSRYRLLTTNTLRSNGRGLKGVAISSPKATLSLRGKWLITLDSINLAHLYNLDARAREHPFFQDYINFIQESEPFTLDLATFSTTDNFLLVKHASLKTYYLFDLRTESAPMVFTNTNRCIFSPTGRYVAMTSDAGMLTLIDLTNPVVHFSILSPRITDMVFTRQDASLIVTTNQTPVGQENDPLARVFSISTLDLTAQQRSLKRLAANVSDYQLFSWADHILATDRRQKQTYRYTVSTGVRTRCPFGQFSAMFVGKTSLVYMNPDQLTDKNQYLYDVLANRIVKLPFQEDEGKIVFYAPSSGPDATLIQLTDQDLHLIDLGASRQSGQFVSYAIPANGTPFIPTSLRVEGSLIKVRRQDGLVFSFLPTLRRNQRDYLDQHIYPQLTKDDKRHLGLIN